MSNSSNAPYILEQKNVIVEVTAKTSVDNGE